MSALARAFSLIRTAPRIGFRNIAAVGLYRLAVSLGWYSSGTAESISGPLLRETIGAPVQPGAKFASLLEEAAEIRRGRLRHFGGAPIDRGSPPNWFWNQFSGRTWRGDQPWWRAGDSAGNGDDIKGVWEASRFDWVLVLARAARASGDVSLLALANEWLTDWIKRNPAFFGPNWKCGQETSIRLMQTLLAVRLLGQDREPEPALVAFVRTHLRRIAQTRAYADAQDNNHATSEAFGLFAGGLWLASIDGAQDGAAWSETGRRWLERAVARLVFEDGGFSQYSVNYHRVMLETLSQTELWRRRLNGKPFSPTFYARACAATRWLAALTNAASGGAPNLGANDGAHVYRLDNGEYGDYRACVQLATSVFCECSAYAAGPWDEPLMWLDLPRPPLDPQIAAKRSRYFPDFGLALLNPREDGSGAYAFVRVPRDRFRPSHADALHFDLWTEDGINLLRDGGSFSYSDAKAMAYFPGIAAHNTITFDGREPMRRISRFLFTDWIGGNAAQPVREGDQLKWSGSYPSRADVTHRRIVTASKDQWLVQDDIFGYTHCAVLRWRFAPGEAILKERGMETQRLILMVEADAVPVRLEMRMVPESRLYAQLNETPGLEVEFSAQTKQILTNIRLK